MLQDGMGWDGRCNGDGMGGMGDAMGMHCELLWGQDGDAAGMGWDGRCQLPALLPGCMVLQHGGKPSSSLSCCSCIKASSERLIGALINSE